MSLQNQFAAIEQLIPHQPPMRLIDKIVSASETSLKATATLKADCPFWTSQGVPACIGLEYLGQAAAAFFSVLAQASNNSTSKEDPRPGMLIASRSYECTQGFFPTDCTLLIEVNPQNKVQSSGLVKFSGTLNELESSRSFAKGDISVYLPPP